MNLILLEADEWRADGQAHIRDPRRLRHLHDVHRASPGDELTLGRLGGGIGRGRLTRLDADGAWFAVDDFDQPPPPPLDIELVLALPRPRMLARSLEHVTALGVKRITLLDTRRVEKSYWQSPELSADKMHQHLLLGLEQARDTVLPEVRLATRFKPFVEDSLAEEIDGRRAMLAHPGMPTACPRGIDMPATLLVGPEGGFIPYEVEQLLAAGCEGVHLGPRILRVETAVVALLARLG